MSETCSFKLSHYQYCLELAKERGYHFFTMEEYVQHREQINNSPAKNNSPDKIIVLRHDLDHFLRLALNLANIEQKLGIKSTYFIRLHAQYSLTELNNYRILMKLSEQGHELGLHHDGDFATLVNENPEEFFIRDKSIFESVINKKIAGISAHEPNKSNFMITDKELAKFNLKYQAYADIFLQEMKYISDSSSRWREGCMCNHIKNNQPKLCILTHPIWWFNQSPIENY